MRLAWAVLACALWSTGLAADVDPFAHPATGEALLRTTLAQPAARLAKAQSLKGRFVHSKHLDEVPRPLVSTGEFTVARMLGVYWHTQQPFDSVVVLTPRGMVQRDEGAEARRLASERQPAVRVMARIFLALFTLDLASLERDFELHGVGHAQGWVLGLKPRSRALAGVFRQATVSGAGDVQQVVLTDAHGDRTVIDLSQLEYSDAPPDADLRALFAPMP
jgi:hypothetical protein